MNIIRTVSVELSTVPAIAYKFKLKAGGAGVKIHRLDMNEVAVFTLDKRTAELVPYGKADIELFPKKAQEEALNATTGLPYSARGSVSFSKISEKTEALTEALEEENAEKNGAAESAEYKAIIKEYSDINSGKLNFVRMNKEFIQFAARSKAVDNLLVGKAPLETVMEYVIKNRAENLSKNKKGLTAAEVKALIEILDEINVRSAFKELSAHIKKMLSSNKK